MNTPTILELLEFEAEHAVLAGAADLKAPQIRDRFGIPPVRYVQLLYQAIDHPTALAIDAVTVNRIRRLRERRRAARSKPFRP